MDISIGEVLMMLSQAFFFLAGIGTCAFAAGYGFARGMRKGGE